LVALVVVVVVVVVMMMVVVVVVQEVKLWASQERGRLPMPTLKVEQPWWLQQQQRDE
jgi:hypothetical protein